MPHNHQNKLTISSRFTSLFNPSSVSNLTLYFNKQLSGSSQSYKAKKILVKQSYLIIAWYKYISSSGSNSSIFILPVDKSKFTIIKSPMAHKTFSQEQFSLKYYNLVTKSTVYLPQNLTTLNLALLTLSSFKLSSRQIGSNLLFTSRLRFELPANTTNLLTYY